MEPHWVLVMDQTPARAEPRLFLYMVKRGRHRQGPRQSELRGSYCLVRTSPQSRPCEDPLLQYQGGSETRTCIRSHNQAPVFLASTWSPMPPITLPEKPSGTSQGCWGAGPELGSRA